MEIINSFLVRRHLWSRPGDKCGVGGWGVRVCVRACVCACVCVLGGGGACVCLCVGGYESVNGMGGGGGRLRTM